jgi:hypothetical protein
MLLQDIDEILHYYAIDYSLSTGEPILLPGNRADMAKILARLTLPLTGTDACIPHIVNSVRGENDEVRLALGSPCGNLSLIHQRLLALSNIAINTSYIWATDHELPVLAPESHSFFKQLSTTLQNLLLHSRDKITYGREPVPLGTALAKLLMNNLQAHILPDISTFKTKAIQWYRDLLLNKNDDLDDMIGFKNGILVA